MGRLVLSNVHHNLREGDEHLIYTLQVKDLIFLDMVIQKHYLSRSKTRFCWVFGLVRYMYLISQKEPSSREVQDRSGDPAPQKAPMI